MPQQPPDAPQGDGSPAPSDRPTDEEIYAIAERIRREVRRPRGDRILRPEHQLSPADEARVEVALVVLDLLNSLPAAGGASPG